MNTIPPESQPPERPRSGHILAGIGIGVGAYVVAIFVILSLFGPNRYPSTEAIRFWVLAPVILGIVLTILRRTRRTGIGVLILSASLWLVFLSMCIDLFV